MHTLVIFNEVVPAGHNNWGELHDTRVLARTGECRLTKRRDAEGVQSKAQMTLPRRVDGHEENAGFVKGGKSWIVDKHSPGGKGDGGKNAIEFIIELHYNEF